MLDWYQLYLKPPIVIRLASTILQVWYSKFLVSQVELSVKTCKKFQHLKYIKTLPVKLSPKIIAALKPWSLVYIYIKYPCANSIRQHYPGGAIIKKDEIPTWMTMIDPTTGWFENFEVLCFDLNDVSRGNIEYIEKLSARVSQMFNQTWLWRHPRPHEVVF